MPITLNWVKCADNNWCNLLTVNLNSNHFDGLEGVYVIWHSGENPASVRIGQGIIRDRLAAHRQDREILEYSQYELYVTWARVSETHRDGVEKYLGETLNPEVGSRLPDAVSIEVNLPW